MSQTIPLDGIINNSDNNTNIPPNITNNVSTPSVTNPINEKGAVHTDISMSLDELINACGQSPEWVMELMEENIIEYDIANTEQFSGYQLATVRRASRISRDFDASVPAIGLIIDLIDELEQLRQFKRQFENQCQVQDQVIEVAVE